MNTVFEKSFSIVAAEVTRLKYDWQRVVFGQRSEPRYLGCYNLKIRNYGTRFGY